MKAEKKFDRYGDYILITSTSGRKYKVRESMKEECYFKDFEDDEE